MAASDGRRRADFEVGDRSAAAFDRLYARLLGAEFYWAGACGVYCLWPVDRYAVEPLGAPTGGCAKSAAMPEYSLASVCGQRPQ